MITPSLSSIQSIPTLIKTFPVPALVKSIPGLGGIFPGSLPKDAVTIFDNSLNQAFTMARAVKVNVSPTSKLMDHPVEDGATTTDYRIINPLEIELALICTGKDYKSVYQQIKTAWLSGDLFTIQTKADTYVRMMISSIPHDEIPDMFDVIAVAVKMREVIIVATQYQPLPASKVKHVNSQSTIHAGNITPTAPPSSLLSQGLNALKGMMH